MFYSMLVTIGEGETDFIFFKQLLNKHYPGLNLSDFLDIRPPDVMIENIPYGSRYQGLVDDLIGNGFTVWVIIKPNKQGHHEVIFSYMSGHTNGIKRMQRFDNRIKEK